MRKILTLLIIMILGVAVYIGLEKEYISKSIDKISNTAESELPQIKTSQDDKEMESLVTGDLFSLMDQTSSEVLTKLGEPVRRDLTPYGYTWWIYMDEANYQIQVGVEDDIVRTIFATGEGVSIEPFSIGSSYEETIKAFPFNRKVTYQSRLAFYTFILQDTDLTTNPLIKLSDDQFVQLYFDTFMKEVSAIRIISGDLLLKQRVYEMEYRGSLPDEIVLSEEEWTQIEKGMEQQIFELTNIYRNRFDLAPLLQNEQVSEVAYLHSKDMFENNYFSHYSEDGSGLKERLSVKEIYYLSAGENIAAQHTDAPAAVEGWLNSEGHREALLHEEYTHLGVGVKQLYYTQNFLLKP